MSVYLGKNKVDMIGGQPTIIEGANITDSKGNKVTGNVAVYNNAIEDWYENFVLTSTDTDGLIYNGTGYMKDYRLNSSHTTTQLTNAIHCGFIKFIKGDIIRVYGSEEPANYTGNYVTFYDGSYAVLSSYNFSTAIDNGLMTYESTSDGFYLATIDTNLLGTTTSTNGVYFRISLSRCFPENFIITINNLVKGVAYKTADKYCEKDICVEILDTSDATATASDMAEGVTAYVNGEKVTGDIPYEKYIYNTNLVQLIPTDDEYKISFMYGQNLEKRIIGGGKYMDIQASASKFGDATASDVVAGKTFTSSAGLKVTGNVKEYPDNNILVMQLDTILGENTSVPQFQSKTFGQASLFRGGSAIQVQANADTFGDAIASDVASGKTFTSSAGVKVTGTASKGMTVKTGTTTSATISTGLSSVSYFVIYKSGISATGLIDAVYDGSTTNMNYCSAWSTSSYGTKTFKSGTATPTISGGTITWNITSPTSGGLSSNTTYNWMAIGTE